MIVADGRRVDHRARVPRPRRAAAALDAGTSPSILIMTCGTLFVMWLGEQIDEFGIGNGISLLIMAGILAQMPSALIDLFDAGQLERLAADRLPQIGRRARDRAGGAVRAWSWPAWCSCTLGQRQIPTQSAKHVRGRRVYGGNRQYLPLRLNQSGVMPIIFASSLLMLPAHAVRRPGRRLIGRPKPGTGTDFWLQRVRQHRQHVQPRHVVRL